MNAVGAITNLFVCDGRNLRREMADEALLEIGMQVGLKFRPMWFLATDNQFLESPLVELVF